MLQLFCKRLHDLHQVLSWWYGIRKKSPRPPHNRQSGKPDDPLWPAAFIYRENPSLSFFGLLTTWKLSTSVLSARIRPFSHFTWICPISSANDTVPFKPDGISFSPSICPRQTCVPFGYFCLMAFACLLSLSHSFMGIPPFRSKKTGISPVRYRVR